MGRGEGGGGGVWPGASLPVPSGRPRAGRAGRPRTTCQPAARPVVAACLWFSTGEDDTSEEEGCVLGDSSSPAISIIESCVETVAVVTVEVESVVLTVDGFSGVSSLRGGRAASGSVWVLLDAVEVRTAWA